jgi:hypothetical protein
MLSAQGEEHCLQEFHMVLVHGPQPSRSAVRARPRDDGRATILFVQFAIAVRPSSSLAIAKHVAIHELMIAGRWDGHHHDESQ